MVKRQYPKLIIQSENRESVNLQVVLKNGQSVNNYKSHSTWRRIWRLWRPQKPCESQESKRHVTRYVFLTISCSSNEALLFIEPLYYHSPLYRSSLIPPFPRMAERCDVSNARILGRVYIYIYIYVYRVFHMKLTT